VVCVQSCLALAAACGGHDAHHTGAARFIVVATVVIGHGYDLLKMLIVPLLATLGSFLGVSDGDVG
jgi:hypothetical protein